MLQFQKFIGKTTTSVVKTTVQIILDEGGSQVRKSGQKRSVLKSVSLNNNWAEHVT